ncbi:MAG TPA: chromate efflux transporter [Candidatus Kapabacteria bacterium]|nr:chromate efflux transporter [Candidatus Kapabacteria bacterium]
MNNATEVGEESGLHPAPRASLGQLARLFLKLGFTAFGGPAAHIAMMRAEAVQRHGWLSEQEFMDLLGATNLIPGPNSTELAIHIGFQQRGWTGMLVAGICFIMPAALIVSGLAWAYTRYGRLPGVVNVLHAIKPVVIAVVVQAIAGLARSTVKNRTLALLGAAALAIALLGGDELLILFGGGTIYGIVRWRSPQPAGGTRPGARSLAILIGAALAMVLIPTLLLTLGGDTASVGTDGANRSIPFGTSPLFLYFLKVGSVLYGSGYVLLAFLRDGLVHRWRWLTETQLLDAVAIGQVTPGPVFTTATFIGYMLGGPWGALVATLGIFLPSFLFSALSGPLVPRLRRSPLTGAFLDGVNAAALALMLAVTWQLAHAALVDLPTIAIAITSAVLLIRFKVNSAWLLLGAAAVGLLLALLQQAPAI